MTDILFPEPLSSDIMAVAPLPINTNMPSPLHLISLFEDDETRWSAVQARDANADGFFVYAVRSTKIYCRPICKARLARRANVRFFTLASEAREAGFRACKRCKPDEKGLMPEEKAVRTIRAFVRDGGEGGSLAQMAKRSGLSKWHFHRVFKRTVGVTPVEYVRMKRKGEVVDPSLVSNSGLSGATTSGSDSPATGSGDSLDWLQEMEWEYFDFEAIESLLDGDTNGKDSTIQDSPEGAGLNAGMSWADFLTWPEDSGTPTT